MNPARNPSQHDVKFLRHLLNLACALPIAALAVTGAFADTPANQVSTQTVQAAQTYSVVPANGEGWFDVGGFCKVVDVGDLSALSPPANGIPVFVPGPADQWENYRTSAPANASYGGKLALTTCCRHQTNIANLCTEAGATPIAVNREYGKLGEVDVVSATCVDQWGKIYTDQINVACSGDNGPDGQAQWAEFGPDSPGSCTPNAFTSACTASCGGGIQTTWDSCGNVQAVNACNTQSCCNPSYSYACSGASYIRTDNTCGTGSATVGACSLQTTAGTLGCSLDYDDSYTCGTGTIDYFQCNSPWSCETGDCSGTCVDNGPAGSFPAVVTGDCPKGNTSPVNSAHCSGSAWTPP